jgi:hypothetical protein
VNTNKIKAAITVQCATGRDSWPELHNVAFKKYYGMDS